MCFVSDTGLKILLILRLLITTARDSSTDAAEVPEDNCFAADKKLNIV